MIRDFFSMAIKNLKKRKLRSWLTMIGITISIATIFVLLSISLGLSMAIEDQFKKLGTDKLFIEPKGQLGAPGSGGAVELTEDDVEIVKRVSGVEEVTYYVAGNARVKFGKKERYVMVAGLETKSLELFMENGLREALEGEPIRDKERGKVMLGSQYKLNNFLDKPIEIGDKIQVNEKNYRVKMIFEPSGSPPDDQMVYMNVEDFRELFPSSGKRVDTIIVKVSPNKDTKEVVQLVEKKLRSHRKVDEKTQDFRISTPEELLSTFNTVLNILTGFLIGIGAISLVVGGIGIANTMYTSVIERTREIGVMKAIGAKNSNILLIFMIESGMLGLVGGAFGIGLGVLIAKIIELIAASQIGPSILQAVIPWYLVLGCLLFSFLVGVISGTLPARQASKIKPVEALRYE